MGTQRPNTPRTLTATHTTINHLSLSLSSSHLPEYKYQTPFRADFFCKMAYQILSHTLLYPYLSLPAERKILEIRSWVLHLFPFLVLNIIILQNIKLKQITLDLVVLAVCASWFVEVSPKTALKSSCRINQNLETRHSGINTKITTNHWITINKIDWKLPQKIPTPKDKE